ncbi:MAG: hypothetical protein ACMVO3_16000 [Thalassobaculum sp.]
MVPRYPGVTSALGCTIADLRQDFVETWNVLLDELDAEALRSAIDRLSEEGTKTVRGAGVALDGLETVVELDMLYVGQTHTVAVPIETGAGKAVDKEAVRAAFENAYSATYGRLLTGIPMRIMNLRVAVVGKRPRIRPVVARAGSGDHRRRRDPGNAVDLRRRRLARGDHR